MKQKHPRNSKMNALLLTMGAGLACTAVLARSSYECKNMALRLYEVQDARIRAPFRVAFLSDLHGNTFGKNHQMLLRCILDARPDAVLIGGDMMVVKPGHDLDLTPLETLLKGLQGRIPVYYAEGNHEQRMKERADDYPGWWERFERLLRQYQVPYLLDDTIELAPGICLSGLLVEEPYYRKLSFRRMKPRDVHRHLPKLSKGRKDAYQILMAHTPEYMDSYFAAGADLVLSGHYHGGTVVLPVLGALMSPQLRFFPKYARGRFEDPKRGAVGIVSAGLGTHSINIRLFNQPELVLVDLLPKEMDNTYGTVSKTGGV
jgi:hypothetical protein